MNLNGKDLYAIQLEWRKRYGTNAPLGLRPTAAERDCGCKGKPQGCERGKCPRRRA